MTKQQQTSKKQKSKFQVKENSAKSLVYGTIIATLIALTPYIFTFYESVPNIKVWDTFLFTYSSNYYTSAQITAWTLMNKLIPLLLIFVWFFTSRHWWYHALLVPIAMYVYQVIEIFNDDLEFIDTSKQIFYLLPVMAIVVPSIYLIRVRIFDKLNDADKTMQDLEDEFKIKPKGILGKLKDYF